MEANFNLGSLKIVHAPLMEYFKTIQNNVSENLILVRDEKKVATNHEALDIISKVQGTLKMIGLNGLVNVLQLVHEGLKGVKEVKFDSTKNAKILEECESILKNVEFYLQNLLQGEMDQPTKFFDQYSKLAALLGHVVSVKDLFIPKLDLSDSVSPTLQSELRTGIVINEESKKSLVDLLKTSQAQLQKNTIEILNATKEGNLSTTDEKKEYHDICKQMYETLDTLQNVKIGKNYYVVFALQKLFICTLSPIFNDQYASIFASNNNEIKVNLGKIERTVNTLLNNVNVSHDGDKTSALKIDDEITRDLLFFIIQVVQKNNALKEMPVYKDVNNFFDISFYANQLQQTKVSVSLGQQNPELALLIEKLFMEIKDEFSLITSKQATNEEFLITHATKFTNLSQKLIEAFSTVKEVQSLMSTVHNAIVRIKAKDVIITDDIQKEISLALVLVEYGINNFVKNFAEDKDKESFGRQARLQEKRLSLALTGNSRDLENMIFPQLDEKSQKADERKGFLRIFEELHNELSKSEEILDQYFRSEGENAEELQNVFKPLTSAKGIFSIIGKPELVPVVSDIISVWKQIELSGLESVEKEKLDVSVACLSGISLLVNAYKNDNEDEAESILLNIVKRYNQSAQEPVALSKPFVVASPSIENNDEITQSEGIVEFVDEQEIDMDTPETLQVEFVDEATTVEDPIEYPVSFVTEENYEIPQLPEITVSNEMEVPVFYEEVSEVTVEPAIIESSLDFEDIVVNGIEYDTEQLAVDMSVFRDTPSDADLLEIYVLESEEVFENLDASFAALRLNITDEEEITNVRRHFHTLKGSGRMVGLQFMGEAGWSVEQTLNRVLSGEIALDYDMLSIIEQVKEKFVAWIEELKVNGSVIVDVWSCINLFKPFNNTMTHLIDLPADPSRQIAVLEENVDEVVSFESTSELAEDELTLEFEKEFNNTDNLSVEFENTTSKEEEETIENMDTLDNIFAQENIMEEKVPELVDTEKNEEFTMQEFVYEDLTATTDTTDELEKDIVMVNGQEVSSSLFDLFNEEKATHLESLKAFMKKNADKESVALTSEFMRHAHTLSSISRTVYLDQVAEIASIIEDISNSAMEKHYLLNNNQVAVLGDAINHLEVLSSIEEQLQPDQDEYEQVISNLSMLQLDMAEEQAEEPTFVEDVTPKGSMEQFTSMLQQFAESIKESFAVQFGSVQKAISEVSQEVNSVKKVQAETETINTAEIVSEVSLNVSKTFDGQYKSFAEIIKKNEDKHMQTVQLLSEKISELEKKLNQVVDTNKQLEEKQRENLELVRKDMRVVVSAIKKKSEPSEGILHEVDGQVIIDDTTPAEQSEQQEFDEAFERLAQTLGIDAEGNINPEEIEWFNNALAATSDVATYVPMEINDEKSGIIIALLEGNEFIKTIFDEKVSTVEDEIDNDLLEISAMETQEMIEQVERILDDVNDNILNIAQNEEIKRYLHTLKGSVKMAGANKVGAIAHRLESLLDYSETRNIPLFTLKPILEKELEKIIFLVKNPSQVLDAKKLAWLDNVVVKTESIHDTTASTAEINTDSKVITRKDEKQFIRIPSDMVDLFINETGEIRLTRTTLEGVIDNNRKSLNELKSSSYKLVKMLREIEIQAESQIEARRGKIEEEGSDFDPLEFDRFTRLQELTRFMNETVSDVQDTVTSMEGSFKTQNTTVVQQSVLTNNLLDSLMKVRLVPMGSVSDRLYKITRNTAKELNKRVKLELVGERTEIDRLVLDKVISPLEHLLRNSIAHGVELPLDRAIKGKEQVGTVTVETALEGNFIVMKIKDDGAGINIEKVREIGLRKNLLNADKEYSKEDIMELIFASGFSTADTISQVSGRGVGMDVVKSEVSSLGGSITISTDKDVGTQFIITLPVAVATNQAMLTEVMGKLVAVPALLVDEVISLKKPALQASYDRGTVEHNGKTYPLYYVGHVMGLLPNSITPEVKTYNTLLIVSYLDQTLAVHIDKLQTTTEILIKSLGAHYSKISGLLGTTLLGNGRQSMVINPVLLKNHYEKHIKPAQIVQSINSELPEKRKETISVMVVDDSITVRRATAKVLERYSYNIIMAKDGEDALEQLQISIPDIILSDIEMPKMDGFEFARNVRNTPKYAAIPIIMITSRTAEKHRAFANSLGVNDFLGKPYQEEELIEKIKLLTNTMDS